MEFFGRKRLLIGGFVLFATLKTAAQSGGSNFEFVENKGQWEKPVRYRADLSTGAFFLHGNGFTILQHSVADLQQLHHHGPRSGPVQKNGNTKDESRLPQEVAGSGGLSNQPETLHSHAYRVSFEGADEDPVIVPEKMLPYYNNYFIGNDRSRWAGNVKIYQALTYKNIYPNVDLRYYSDYGRLKYDLVIHPGADLSKIRMRYQGADQLSIKKGELLIKTSVGVVKELSPYSYQLDPSTGKQEVNCRYEIVGGNTVLFRVKDYNRNNILVIDPTLIFSSFTGSTADNYGFTATPGPDGSFFSGSIVFGQGFPVTTGAFQTIFGGGGGNRPIDIGIMRFSPNGSARLYATYIGGDNSETPQSLFADAQGNLVVLGKTYSANYPTTTKLGAGGSNGDADIVITKLNNTGSAIIGSIRIGGTGNDGVNIEDVLRTANYGAQSLLRNYGDESRAEVIIDGAGFIYVAAQTQSVNFPVVGSVFQPALAGGQDAVVMKINPNCNTVIWSSYLGGSANDGAFVLDLNPLNGDIYVAGGTASSNFPVTAGVRQPAYAGDVADGFVTAIRNDGSGILYSTFLGTSGIDIIYGIKFDRKGFPYVMGVSRGAWPVINATYSNPNSKQFVAKLQPNLSDFVYSTVFGSGSPKPNMSPVAFLVDRCENVYISGWGGWIIPSSPIDLYYDLAGVAGMPTTPDAIKSSTDNRDFYFIVIQKNASALLYGSFFGQNGGDGEHVDGGTSRFDAQGVIYQAICANCGGGATFPTTPGVVSPVNGALNIGGCNLAAVKISFNFAGVAAGPQSLLNGVRDTSGCIPLTLQFRDTVLNAKNYEWDFGDGSPPVQTNTPNTNHTFTNVGTYRVRLIAIDSNTCNVRDTAYLTVVARNDRAALALNVVKLLPCQSLSYRFDNLSVSPPGKPFGSSSFTWDFGDGSRVTVGPGSVTHSYTAPGTYKVKLILPDTAYCNSPDSISVDLRIAPLVKALFDVPLSGCVPFDAVFNNVSDAGQQFFWDFGDGTSSTQVNPAHTYNNTGTYTVKLVAVDSATCNIIDSIQKTITVNPRPTSDFNYSPITPETNKPTAFFNLATGGVRYKWLFGDGDSTLRTTTDSVMHQYNATGTYQACLVVYNQFDCTDTVCKPIQAQVVPLLDVPNAFTPGRFGRNSTIRVEGFGIARMTWRIYNRWGQIVFESRDRKIGWDGTFKGQIQPMDVYAYTLEVDFTDGTKARKTGDITLIR